MRPDRVVEVRTALSHREGKVPRRGKLRATAGWGEVDDEVPPLASSKQQRRSRTSRPWKYGPGTASLRRASTEGGELPLADSADSLRHGWIRPVCHFTQAERSGPGRPRGSGPSPRLWPPYPAQWLAGRGQPADLRQPAGGLRREPGQLARRAVAAMSDNVGGRMETVAVSDNGTALAIPTIRFMVDAERAKTPTPDHKGHRQGRRPAKQPP
jgi:hypothetical protein